MGTSGNRASENTLEAATRPSDCNCVLTNRRHIRYKQNTYATKADLFTRRSRSKDPATRQAFISTRGTGNPRAHRARTQNNETMSLGEGLRGLANLGIKGPSDLSRNIDK